MNQQKTNLTNPEARALAFENATASLVGLRANLPRWDRAEHAFRLIAQAEGLLALAEELFTTKKRPHRGFASNLEDFAALALRHSGLHRDPEALGKLNSFLAVFETPKNTEGTTTE